MNRLLIWYSVFVAAFRCPSSLDDLTDQSPNVCKPYLAARSFVTPYLEPYYDNYAAPYVDAVRPYVQQVEEQIYRPVATYGKHGYEAYGAPRIDQSREYIQVQWDKFLKPQIDTAQAQIKEKYDRSFEPHVARLSTAAAPYYSESRDTILWAYNNYFLPAYTVSRPYVEKTYAFGYEVAVERGLPYAKSAIGSTMIFVDRTLWPQLRILYGRNVEPQLMRIGERLGRYRDGKKLKASIEEIDR